MLLGVEVGGGLLVDEGAAHRIDGATVLGGTRLVGGVDALEITDSTLAGQVALTIEEPVSAVRIVANAISGEATGLHAAAAATGEIAGNRIFGGVTGVLYDAPAALGGNTISGGVTGLRSTVALASGALGFVSGSGGNTISGGAVGVELVNAIMQDPDRHRVRHRRQRKRYTRR